MKFEPIADNAARQSIDAATVFEAYLGARVLVQACAGSMYWRKDGGDEYLVKAVSGKQQRLGRRSPTTESLLLAFRAKKAADKQRLSALKEALEEAQRINKAVRAGRTPDTVVKILNAVHDAGLANHWVVSGTHTLYAYESAAGVRIVPDTADALAVDPFRDAKCRLEVLLDTRLDGDAILAVLQRADRSFRLSEVVLEGMAFMNNKGFVFSVWSPTSRPGSVLALPGMACAPRFTQTVISVTGKMALMQPLAPHTFIAVQRWRAAAEGEDTDKGRRYALQASIVQEMLDAKLLKGVGH
jgi:hypothetical protein